MSSYKYSFIDRVGKVIIDASKYKAVSRFSDGLAAVYVEDETEYIFNWGFIDKAGNEVIVPQFRGVGNFSEGLVAVEIEGKWGFINKTGNFIIPPAFDAANEFSEGIAIVAKGKEVLLINHSGQTIFSESMDVLQLNIYEDARFSEGLIDAYDCTREKYGFIDQSGQFVIEPKFDDASPFSEGLARIMVRENSVDKIGFIDHQGQLVIPPTFNADADFRRNSADFSEGLAAVTECGSSTITEALKFAYIDKRGTIRLFTDFFYAGSFRDGLAAVYSADRNKWGFIDKSGQVVISVEYDFADYFSEGLAWIARLALGTSRGEVANKDDSDSFQYWGVKKATGQPPSPFLRLHLNLS